MERCQEVRNTFALEIGAYPVEYLVAADEAAVNILTTYRTNGWSIQGLRARKRCNFVRGTRYVLPNLDNLYLKLTYQNISYSMLPALTVDGIIYSHIKIGGYNGDQFMEWLEGVLSVMNPYPAPRSVLILDNCRIHHVPGVEELCAERFVGFCSFRISSDQ
jgi:hypothetical protein